MVSSVTDESDDDPNGQHDHRDAEPEPDDHHDQANRNRGDMSDEVFGEIQPPDERAMSTLGQSRAAAGGHDRHE
jgi:hypothetical protein